MVNFNDNTANKIILPINGITIKTPPDSYLDDRCSCGCKRLDHRMGPKMDKLKRGACRMCSNCRKFKQSKPIKSKIKK